MHLDPIELFRNFIKRVEDIIEIAKATKFSCAGN